MSQPGHQTTLIYGSLIAGHTPPASTLATNLSGVELAINAADGKLFYKDTFGNVQLLADKNQIGASGNATIISGSINGTTIGATTPSTGNFTSLTTQTLTVPSLVGMVKSNGNLGFSVGVPGVDYVSGAMVASPNGVASLDATGKVPLSQLPSGSGGLNYLGTWNAATNTPTLVSGVGTKGFFYKVSVAGSTMLDGNSTWVVGDQVIFNGTVWERVAESTAPVQSVNGMTGAVVITRTGLSAAGSGANSDITSLSGLTSALSVSQGGTGRTTLSGIVKANGTAPFSAAVAGTDYAVPTNGTNTQLLANNGAGGFSNVTIGSGLVYSGGVLSSTGGTGTGTVTSVDVTGGSTGLTFGGGPVTTSGTIIMAGTLSVGNGGTGKTTLSGLLKGNGTSPIVSAIAGTDYAVPTNGTTAQLLANNGAGGFSNVTVGSGLTYTGGVLAATGSGGGGVGTVTSIDVSGGATGITFSGGPITSSGTITMAGKLAVSNGGTGVTTITGLIRGNGTSPFSTAVAGTDYAAPTTGTNTQLLANNGAGGFVNVTVGSGLAYSGGVLSFSSSGVGTVTSVNASGGTTGLTFSGGPVTTSGTLTLSGTLAVPSGGTGATALTGVLKGNGTSAISTAVAGTDYAAPTTGNNTQLLANNGIGGFSNVTVGSGLSYVGGILSNSSGGTVTSVNASGGTTGLSFSGGPITSSGTLTLSGTLAVANGGTGRTTLSGILKGNGTSAINQAIAGTDYAAPTTGTNTQLLANNGAGGFSNVTVGSGLSYTGGVLTATGGSSSVFKIAVIGDSLTAQQSMLAPSWPQLLQEDLRGSGVNVEVYNLAINGWTYLKANTVAAFGSNTMVQEAISLAPNMVIVALGVNDMQYMPGDRPLATVINDATTCFNTLKTALPSATIVYASPLPYDNVNATNPGTTLLNRQVLPALFATRTSPDLLANCYCSEIMDDSVAANTKTATTNFVAIDNAVKGLSSVNAYYTMPVWKAARLGLLGFDMLHPKAEASIVWASAAREQFNTDPVLQAALPGLSDQAYVPFNKFSFLFDSLLTLSGGQYVTVASPDRNANHVRGQHGPWLAALPDVWYLPSKGNWDDNSSLYVQGEEYLWRIVGGPPNTTIEASIDGAAFGAIGKSTDGRGNYVAAGKITLSPGAHTTRFRVGNEIFGPISQTVLAGTFYTPVNTFNAAMSAITTTLESKADLEDVAVATSWMPKLASGANLVGGNTSVSANAKTPIPYDWTNVSVSDPSRFTLTQSGDNRYIRVIVPAGKTVRWRAEFSVLFNASTGTNNAHSIGFNVTNGAGTFLYAIQLDFKYSPVAGYATVAHGSFPGASNADFIITPWVWTTNGGTITSSGPNGVGSYWGVEIISEA